MNQLKEIKFNAAQLRIDLEQFLGLKHSSRGNPDDEFLLRWGTRKSFAELVDQIAERLEERIRETEFKKSFTKSNIILAADQLRSIANGMRMSENAEIKEPEDYHWMIVGGLVSVVDALLEDSEV